MTFKFGVFSGMRREFPRVFIIHLILAELTQKKKKKEKEVLFPSALGSQLNFQISGGRKTGENQVSSTDLINQTEQICSCRNMMTSIKSELPGGRDLGLLLLLFLLLAISSCQRNSGVYLLWDTPLHNLGIPGYNQTMTA